MSTQTVVEPSPTALDYYIDAPAPGLHKDVPPETYSRWSAVRSSLLRKVAQSPYHARYAMLHPEDEDTTKAKDFGQAFHVGALEPDRFNIAFGVMPNLGPRQSSKVRAEEEAYRAAHAHIRMISKDDYDLVIAMRDAVWQHPTAKEILSSPGANELSAVWKDKGTGVLCKGRQDRFGVWADAPTVVDLKSTVDASRATFSRSIATYGYDQQSAYYLDGFNALAPVDGRKYVLIAVEKTAPYAVAVYELDQASIAAGRRKYRANLELWARCLESGVFPGYGDGCDDISLPAYALREEEFY